MGNHLNLNYILCSAGNGTFADVTEEVGVGPPKYGSGAVWADVDEDGDLDLYVTTMGDSRHYLYINQVRKGASPLKVHDS